MSILALQYCQCCVFVKTPNAYVSGKVALRELMCILRAPAHVPQNVIKNPSANLIDRSNSIQVNDYIASEI